jgi:hypothetical protein
MAGDGADHREPIDRGAALHGRDDPGGHGDGHGDQQRRERQLDRRGQPLHDQLGDGPAAAQ